MLSYDEMMKNKRLLQWLTTFETKYWKCLFDYHDTDGDGVLNQGEEATLFFELENTSVDGFAYAVTAELFSNDYFDVLSDTQFIEELPAQVGPTTILFNIKIKDDAPIGDFLMNLSINATVYQDDFGDFDYDDNYPYRS